MINLFKKQKNFTTNYNKKLILKQKMPKKKRKEIYLNFMKKNNNWEKNQIKYFKIPSHQNL